MSQEESDMASSGSASPSPEQDQPNRKRKREDRDYNEIEVDVSLPEPPSKKALRRAKKGKPTKTAATGDAKDDDEELERETSKRSEYGVWIGNLPWSAGKPELTKFILENAKIAESDITRIHMPAPSKVKMDVSRQKLQPQNKGFAYVDFKTDLACKAVIALSEKLLTGRRLLIKNAKSFEGRPAATEKKEKYERPPNKRIFVGNLSIDTIENDLKDQFSKCGEVLSVFMATFEDSGRCKGYAWVTFKELDAAEKAVRGWVEFEKDASNSDDEADDKKPNKPRKWWVNRLHGRQLRMEFAEDATTRYQKRYGKGKDQADRVVIDAEPIVEVSTETVADQPRPGRKDKLSGSQFKKERPRVDARSIAPGAALSKAPRQSAAIVESEGKKLVFD